jgi:hypothetical protein
VNNPDDKQKILEIIDSYVHAFETANVDLFESLFWTDDPRFSEVENDRAKPFGWETFHSISAWIRQHGEPGGKMRFHDTAVYILSPEGACSVSMRDEYEGEKAIPSRVTLIFLKKEGDRKWKSITTITLLIYMTSMSL